MKKLLLILLLFFIFIISTYVITYDLESVAKKDFKSIFTEKKNKLPSLRYDEDKTYSNSPPTFVDPPNIGDNDIFVTPPPTHDDIVVPK